MINIENCTLFVTIFVKNRKPTQMVNILRVNAIYFRNKKKLNSCLLQI